MREGFRSYRSFGGVDASAPPLEIPRHCLAALENMWRDYGASHGGALETAPGFRQIASLPGRIHSLARQKTGEGVFLLAHAGGALFRIPWSLRHRKHAVSSLSPIGPLADGPSVALPLGEEVLLLDGNGYYRVTAEGVLQRIGGPEGDAYTPTVFHNCEEYEQKNLLTDRVKEAFSIHRYSEYEDASEGLIYKIIDPEAYEVSVAGDLAFRDMTYLTIPEKVLLGGVLYTVTKVEASGFYRFEKIRSLSLPATVKHLGPSAFQGCVSLSEVILPEALAEISSFAFKDCTALEHVYLNAALERLYFLVFDGTHAPLLIHYPLDEEAFAQIRCYGDAPFGEGAVIHYNDLGERKIPECYLFPIRSLGAEEILSVTLDGERITAEAGEHFGAEMLYERVPRDESQPITGVRLSVSNQAALLGRGLEVLLRTRPGTEEDVIGGCTLLAQFDGRLFFAGNPRHPDTVYYTGLDRTGTHRPGYVGVLNYFKEDGAPITAMLPRGNALLLFREDGTTEGSVILRSPQSTGEALVPRVYAATEGFHGIACTGACAAIPGDTVFFTPRGLWGLEEETFTQEKSAAERSSRIAPLLEEAYRAHGAPRMAFWEGYLLLLFGDRLFLGDTRQAFSHEGHKEYEWYPWTGIGSYHRDRLVLRYAPFLPPGETPLPLSLHPHPGEIPAGECYHLMLGDGTSVYYAEEKDDLGQVVRYALDTEGEYEGGIFSPATALFSMEGLLLFGTEEGDLCLFSTDMRGETLYREKKDEGYVLLPTGYCSLSQPELLTRHGGNELTVMPLYAKHGSSYVRKGEGLLYTDGVRWALCEEDRPPLGKDRIPPYFYTQAGHAYPSGCSLGADHCDLPQFSKRTLPRSLLLQIKRFPGTHLQVLCRTDRRGWRLVEEITQGGGDGDFTALDFQTEETETALCREKETGWREKQLRFQTEGFRQPFGIYSVTYRYREDGRYLP